MVTRHVGYLVGKKGGVCTPKLWKNMREIRTGMEA